MELFLVRALERVIAVAVGGLSIYLGYRLFLAVKATGEGSAEIKLPGDVTVMVSRVGPGVFFALFGAVVIGISLAFPVRYSETEMQTLGGGSVRTKEISGIGGDSGVGSTGAARTPGAASQSASSEEVLEMDRLRVREYVAFLNQLILVVDPALPEAQQARVREKATATKLRLMHTVWSHDWGRFEDFQSWVEGDQRAENSKTFRKAAEFFAYGQQRSQ